MAAVAELEAVNIVVGLGNPGPEYERTPHNAGFLSVRELAERAGATLRRRLRVSARTARATCGGRDVLLVQPLTFMNLSGKAVQAILNCHGASPSDMIVVLDDADLELGVLRIRQRGGSGGHKGLQSILEGVGTDAFCRVRIGVGRGPTGGDLARFLLTPLTGDDWERLKETVQKAADAVEMILENGADAAMNRYNASAPPAEGVGM